MHLNVKINCCFKFVLRILLDKYKHMYHLRRICDAKLPALREDCYLMKLKRRKVGTFLILCWIGLSQDELPDGRLGLYIK